MSYFWPFNYFLRREPQEEQADEPADEAPDTTGTAAQVPVLHENRGSDFAYFRSMAENNPEFIPRLFLHDPLLNPATGPSNTNNEPQELPSLEETQSDDSHLSEAARRLRKRTLEQRIANRENRLRARDQQEPTPNIRSNPIALQYDGVDITFQRTSHRQERKFGLLVI